MPARASGRRWSLSGRRSSTIAGAKLPAPETTPATALSYGLSASSNAPVSPITSTAPGIADGR
ncbi:hypothetical protein ACLQ24_11805 [Micromonospora sp. DT4]|uniref:hypothetical protein n=1 Tax=Micromonospora sp. DT4 TaxID=3393438 RepID=UPI003CF0F57A